MLLELGRVYAFRARGDDDLRSSEDKGAADKVLDQGFQARGFVEPVQDKHEPARMVGIQQQVAEARGAKKLGGRVPLDEVAAKIV